MLPSRKTVIANSLSETQNSSRASKSAQHRIAFIAEEIGLVEASAAPRKEVAARGQQRFGRNIRRDEHKAHQLEGMANLR